MPTVIQHALDAESPPTCLEKHARNPEIGQDVISTGCQWHAVCTCGVADGEVGVLSVRGRFQGDLVCLGVLRPSGIEGYFGRNAQSRIRQGFCTGCLGENGTAEVDEEDLVTDCSCQSRD